MYRIPEPAIRPVLEQPAALRFVARRLSSPARLLARAQPAPPPQGLGRPVSDLIRAPPVVCPPGTRIQDAARRMVEGGASCVLVELDGGCGIVTDRDIRTRVIAEGCGPDTPLGDVMSSPARTVAADRTAAEALLDMLDHGIRHLPVLDTHRRLIGVLDDIDLLAGEHRAPFRIRALVAGSADVAGVAAAARGLAPAVIALHDAGVGASAISRMIAAVHDSATRRLIELAEAELGTPPVPFAWLATGSFGAARAVPQLGLRLRAGLGGRGRSGGPGPRCWRSPSAWWRAWGHAVSDPTRTERSPRAPGSPARPPAGRRPRARGWTIPIAHAA